MTLSPTPAAAPMTRRAYGFGLAAGLGIALVYAVLAEVLGLTWGLVAVGFIGGMIIGNSVVRGAWQDSTQEAGPRVRDRGLQIGAVAIALASWMVGVTLAFVVSQAVLPDASTPLVQRLSPANFTTYLFGLDEIVRVIHVLSGVGLVVMAWRGAR